MTEEVTDNKNEPQPEEKVILPGQLVKAARIRATLTEKQLAKKVNLKASIIQDIENNKYDPSVSPTFSRGYLKLIAKTLDIPEQDLLEGYEKLNIKHKPSDELQSFSRRTIREANDNRLMMISYAIGCILIALAVVWWLQQDSSVQPITTIMPTEELEQEISGDNYKSVDLENLPVTSAENNKNEIATNLQSDNTGNENLANSSDSSEEVMEESLPNVTTEKVQNPSQEPDLAIQPAQIEANSIATSQADSLNEDMRVNDEISEINESQLAATDNLLAEESQQQLFTEADYVDMQLTFQRDCWVKLTDATGDDIAYGIKATGYVMNVSGVPPINLTLCAPEFVEVIFDGSAIDMSQFTQARTAKFELPLIQE